MMPTLTPTPTPTPTAVRDAVLSFWFSRGPDQYNPAWFAKDPAFDAAIARQFGAAVEQAAGGALDALTDHAEGALALCILLDQFPRNLHRGTARAFACDGRALEIAQTAVAAGLDAGLTVQQRMFFYLPFEHSEDPAMQDRSLALFAALGDPELMRYAQMHADIIARFGRYPHRNAALGRTSTPEETAFLLQPNSSF